MIFGKKKDKQKPEQPKGPPIGNILKDGLVSLKDIIAPSFVEVDFNHIKIDEKFYRTLFVVGYPRYVSPNWLSSLISFDHPLYLSMFIYPTQSGEILKDLRRKIITFKEDLALTQATLKAILAFLYTADSTQERTQQLARLQIELEILLAEGRSIVAKIDFNEPKEQIVQDAQRFASDVEQTNLALKDAIQQL